MSLDDTRTATQSLHPIDAAPRPGVLLIDHPDARFVGTARVIAPGESVMLGRGSEALIPGVFVDSRISRRHATLTNRGGTLTLTDHDSRNGTLVGGVPVDTCQLSDGDVVTLGPVLLMVRWMKTDRVVPPRGELVGISAALAEALALVDRVARRPVTVLVVGEPGVGKELIAQEVHRRSARPGALVAVNSAGIADGVLSSELFGHTRGAFSGATGARSGLVEAARGGTLFLDEIGDASPLMQASLLRLLQQREYRPVGADRVIKADVRFVAATNRRMVEAVSAGGFRADLYSRLSRCVIQLPPLRERPEDILPLARHFAGRIAERPVGISHSLALALLRHHWPGNVRGLEGVIERIVLEHEDSDVLPEPPWLAAELALQAGSPVTTPTPAAPKSTGRPSAEALSAVLRRHGGNVSAVAAELGVGRNTLYRWMRGYELSLESFR
ncbi:MAG: transcriptional regulator with PAS, ATPase and Fis domain [Myxococcota bacterium]|jgi:transcriptional regulator with PAS, ATPase and Fis domain